MMRNSPVHHHGYAGPPSTPGPPLVYSSASPAVQHVPRQHVEALEMENALLRRKLFSLQDEVSNASMRTSLIDSLQQRLVQARQERDREVRESDALFSQLQEHMAAKQEAETLKAALVEVIAQIQSVAADTDTATRDQLSDKAGGAALEQPSVNADNEQLLTELQQAVAVLKQQRAQAAEAALLFQQPQGAVAVVAAGNELVEHPPSPQLAPERQPATQALPPWQVQQERPDLYPHAAAAPQSAVPFSEAAAPDAAACQEPRQRTQRRLDWEGCPDPPQPSTHLPAGDEGSVVCSAPAGKGSRSADISAAGTDAAAKFRLGDRAKAHSDGGATADLLHQSQRSMAVQGGDQGPAGHMSEEQQQRLLQRARELESHAEQLASLLHLVVLEQGQDPQEGQGPQDSSDKTASQHQGDVPHGDAIGFKNEHCHHVASEGSGSSGMLGGSPYSADQSTPVLERGQAAAAGLGDQCRQAGAHGLAAADAEECNAKEQGLPQCLESACSGDAMQPAGSGPKDLDSRLRLQLQQCQDADGLHALPSVPEEAGSLGNSPQPGVLDTQDQAGPCGVARATVPPLRLDGLLGLSDGGAAQGGGEAAAAGSHQEAVRGEAELERLKRHNAQLRLDNFVSRAQLRIARLVPAGSSYGTPITPATSRPSRSTLSPRDISSSRLVGVTPRGRRTGSPPLRVKLSKTPRGAADVGADRSPRTAPPATTAEGLTPEARSIRRLEEDRIKVSTVLNRAQQQRARLKSQVLRLHDQIAFMQQENTSLRQRLQETAGTAVATDGQQITDAQEGEQAISPLPAHEGGEALAVGQHEEDASVPMEDLQSEVMAPATSSFEDPADASGDDSAVCGADHKDSVPDAAASECATGAQPRDRTAELEDQVQSLTARLAQFQGYLEEAQEEIARLQGEVAASHRSHSNRRTITGSSPGSAGVSPKDRDHYIRSKVVEIQEVVRCIMHEKERLQMVHQQQLGQMTQALQQVTTDKGQLEQQLLDCRATIADLQGQIGVLASGQQRLPHAHQNLAAGGPHPAHTPSGHGAGATGATSGAARTAVHSQVKATSPVPLQGSPLAGSLGHFLTGSPALPQLTPNPLFEPVTSGAQLGRRSLTSSPIRQAPNIPAPAFAPDVRSDGAAQPLRATSPSAKTIACWPVQVAGQGGFAGEAGSAGTAMPSSTVLAGQKGVGVSEGSWVSPVDGGGRSAPGTPSRYPDPATMTDEEVVAYSHTLKDRIVSEVHTLSQQVALAALQPHPQGSPSPLLTHQDAAIHRHPSTNAPALQPGSSGVTMGPGPQVSPTAFSTLGPELSFSACSSGQTTPAGVAGHGHGPNTAVGTGHHPLPHSHANSDVEAALGELKGMLQALQVAPHLPAASPSNPLMPVSAPHTATSWAGRWQQDVLHTPGLAQVVGMGVQLQPLYTTPGTGSASRGPGSTGKAGARGSGASSTVTPMDARHFAELPPSVKQYAPPSLRGASSSVAGPEGSATPL